jgi:hypothetical protein
LKSEKTLLFGMVIFSVLFPIIFVIWEKSNIYSSWRQFLFLYPAIVLLTSTGYLRFYEYLENRYLKWGMAAVLVLLSVHPLRFMSGNPQFYYLYYNQLTGSLKGAY